MRSIETMGHGPFWQPQRRKTEVDGLDSHVPVSSLSLEEADGGEQFGELVNNIIRFDAFFLRQALV